MKTINHKGKTLHHHAPTGFYIDLAELRRVIVLVCEKVDANQRIEMPLLVVRTRCIVNHVKREPWGNQWHLVPNYGADIYWTVNVRMAWNGHYHADEIREARIYPPHLSKYEYSLPFAYNEGNCGLNKSDEDAINHEWFPVSACYSPARIMLENAQ